jgi:hypothetical protein
MQNDQCVMRKSDEQADEVVKDLRESPIRELHSGSCTRSRLRTIAAAEI